MDKYKNIDSKMPLHIPESLFEHYLYENANKAQQLFQKAGFKNDDEIYLKFKEAFSGIPEFQGKIAEWIMDIVDEGDNWEDSDIDIATRQIEYLHDEIKKFINQGYKIDFDPEPIKGAQNFINQLNKSAKKQRGQFKDQFKIDSTPKVKIKNPQLKLPGMSGDRLWIYGVLIKTRNETFVKFGDHRGPSKDDAIEYAMYHTIGKSRAMVGDSTEIDIEDLQKQGKEIESVSLIFVEDVTDYAASRGYKVEDQKFDDYIRHNYKMPGKWGIMKNSRGQISRELHKHDIREKDSKIISDWKDSIEKMLEEGGIPKKKEETEARPFHNEMIQKLDLKENGKWKSDKHLLGAATGAGKELVTLSTIIYINDSREFDKNTVHVATATIPSTISELFKELSAKSGISTAKGKINFSRIKPYCLKRFAKKYQEDLPGNVKEWFDENVTKIERVEEIKERTENQIPVLFGSFPDLGLKTANEDPSGAYKSLGDRIGILSIGEGHQFLSNPENKLWKSIKEKLHYKFLLVITGTPYDFIFNEAGQDYFSPEERTLFTRNDLYKLKREDPDGPFGNYPDINYFSLNIGSIYEEMKKDPSWEDDKHGFTWQKFFQMEKGKFKYSTLIIKLFAKLFSVDYDTGEPDPLSIEKVPEKYLSEDSKKNVIVALPVGSGEEGVQKYIPELIALLRKKGALGSYIALDPYTDNLKEIKETIEKEGKSTITFTCNKYLTGTDIPAWGTLIFLRPIGSSLKFFEQATGRISRALKNGKKEEVGVFLGNLENAVNLHISVDELMASEKNENIPYDEIVKKTLKNYNWIKPDKKGEWSLINDWRELADLQGELAGDIDYGTLLCLKKTHAPKDFNLRFNKIIKDAREQIEISSSDNKGAKNKEIERKVKQLQIEFKKAQKDPEKWYRNMIATHIPKIITLCVIYDIKTIEDFSERIKKDQDLLRLIGDGYQFVTSYINEEDQINIKYINRKISILLEDSSDEGGFDNFKKRYDIINNRMNIKKLTDSIIFDPLKLTNEICEKIEDPLKKANKILIIEKNGSFLYSTLEQIKYNNLKKISLIIPDPLSLEIINYLLKGDTKLVDIQFIKDIERDSTKILNMQFDVFIGNPPFQPFESSGTGNKIWPKFIEIGFKVLKENGWIAMISPNHWRLLKSERGVHREAQKLMWENNIIDVQPANKFFDVGGVVKMDYWIITKNKNIKGLKISEDLRKIMFLPENNEKMILSFFEDAEKEDDIYIRNLPQNDNRNFDSLIKKKEGDNSHPYPHISTLPQYEEGLFDWYDEKTKGFDSKKVMVFRIRSKNRRALYDGGGIGCGHQASGYLINSEEEGKKLENFLNNSKIIQALEEEGKIGFTIPVHFFNKIPKSWVERFNKGEDL